jgi:hypothetical protein
MREWLGTVAEILGRLARWALLRDVPTSLVQLAGIAMIARGVAMFSVATAWIVVGLFALLSTIWRGSDV